MIKDETNPGALRWRLMSKVFPHRVTPLTQRCGKMTLVKTGYSLTAKSDPIEKAETD
jgi:hypothetical protein